MLPYSPALTVRKRSASGSFLVASAASSRTVNSRRPGLAAGGIAGRKSRPAVTIGVTLHGTRPGRSVRQARAISPLGCGCAAMPCRSARQSQPTDAGTGRAAGTGERVALAGVLFPPSRGADLPSVPAAGSSSASSPGSTATGASPRTPRLPSPQPRPSSAPLTPSCCYDGSPVVKPN